MDCVTRQETITLLAKIKRTIIGPVKLDKLSNLDRRARIGEDRRAKTRAAIIAAAFELLGKEQGTQLRVEDVARTAKLTRATFYNHFSGLPELRDAVSHELTHEFRTRVMLTIGPLKDPAERTMCAIRFFLHRAQSDHSWAKSLINLSSNGILFGAETYKQAEINIGEGMEARRFLLRNSALGRDLVLGSSLAAMSNIVQRKTDDDYPELIAGHILCALGMPFDEAREMANRRLPELSELPGT